MMPVKLLVKASGHQSRAKPRQCSEKGSGQVQLPTQGPNTPFRPRKRTEPKPAMTGGTEKGRSISATKRERPLNRNFVTAQAAASPKMRLRGTMMAAIPMDSRIEFHVFST